MQIRKELKVEAKSSEIVCGEVGCVMVVALITEDKIFTANIGDCRAVLNRGGTAIALSTDHKPTNSGEKSRIIKHGGKVINGRINNGLNVSRALGDFKLKRNSKKLASELLISIP